MLFYHGTSEENWLKIQEEGVLFGKRNFGISRCTYLTNDINEAKCYGKVILSVEYDPFLDKDNNYAHCTFLLFMVPLNFIFREEFRPDDEK